MNERPATQTMKRCLLISDFNLCNLAAFLRLEASMPLEIVEAAFGQVEATLMSDCATVWSDVELACVWTLPQRVCPTFNQALAHEPFNVQDVLAEVDAFADMIVAASDRCGALLVATWTAPPNHRGLGLIDWTEARGIAPLISRMNLRLAERLAPVKGAYLLDTQRWIQAGGNRAANPKLWYMSKTPYSNDVLKEAAKEIMAAVVALRGGQRKLIVVDLDNTLWGGVVGDRGWEHVALGGHDPNGEAFTAFQQALKALQRRGLLLAISSKNDETVALEAIRRHPEMVLREDDFVAWRINWGDKAANVADLAAELNLGLQSVVFIDDNPAERMRVAHALPEVLVPDWPSDPARFVPAVHALTCFDAPVLTADDTARTSMYRSERERQAMRASVGSVESWLRSLDMRVTREGLHEGDLARATQLLNKTNQMNLTTRRLTESQLRAWTQAPGRNVWTFRVADRIGDMGLTGLLSVETRGAVLQIIDFILSCRVFGRRIEDAMLATAVEHAASLGLQSVQARYLATAKNGPCLAFLERSGMLRDEDVFSWPVASQSCAYPDVLTLEAAGTINA